MPRLPIRLLAAAALSLAAAAAEAGPPSGLVALGDGHDIRVTNSGPGSDTVLDLDGQAARIDTLTASGGRTRVLAHGNGARVALENHGGDLTVFAGACPAPRVPRVTFGAGTAFVTCH